MKRITLLLNALFFVAFANAQSQRLVLMEEFTQASCGPCAASNPAFNTLLNANNSKIVSIKYQTVWPGDDVMNMQNPTEVATRVTYYNITGVPSAKMDGGSGFSGGPSSMTQANITNRYNVPSPFTIDVDFHLSPTNDSIYCHAHIVCTQPVSGTLVAHTAVIERKIYFTPSTAPGTNGELEFEGVMKKMLPTVAGTALNSSMDAGDSLDLNFAWKFTTAPFHVYDLNQLAVVVFIQNNANKQVLQTGFAAPHIDNDAGVLAVDLPGVQCANDVQPVVTVRNYSGLSPLNSFDLVYKIDNGSDQTIPVTGSIAPGASYDVTLPVLNLPSGRHTFAFSTANPNSTTDQDNHNNSDNTSVAVYSTPVSVPVAQEFTATAFPPNDFQVENVDHDEYTWTRSAVGHNFAGSAKLSFFAAPEGTIDYMYVPKFDFSNALTGRLSFDVSHAQYDASMLDRLKVNASTDCGAHWVNIYNKAGSALATAPIQTTGFSPNGSQWRTENVSLDQFVGSPDLLIQFEGVSAWGNNVFVDNINIIDQPLGISNAQLDRSIEMYPNPAQSEVNLRFALEKSTDVTVTILNSLGAIVKVENYSSLNNETKKLDISSLAKGAYSVNINANGEMLTKRLTVTQ